MENRKADARDAARRRARSERARLAGTPGTRSERARLAGIASGVARREAAKDRGRHPRKRQCIVSRKRHRALFEAYAHHHDTVVSERGLETDWRVYRSFVARGYDGRAFETTNGQQTRALATYGRPRCARTVQRHRAILAAMGLIGSKPVHRHGSMTGERDTVRVWLCTVVKSFVTLLRKKEEEEPSAHPSPPSTTQIEPPCGGRERPPDKPAGNCSDEKTTAPLPFFDMAAARRRARARYQ